MKLFWRAGLTALVLGGCATGRFAVEPTHVDHGMLLARVVVRGALLSFLTDEPDMGAVGQVGADGELLPGKTAFSTLAKDGTLYFLDLPPGKYMMIKVSFPARGARYEVELSSAAMRRRVVELGPGKAAFLGEIDLAGRFPDFDIAVDHAVTIAMHWLTPFLSRPHIPLDAEIRSHLTSVRQERRALAIARRELAATQWVLRIDGRFDEIGSEVLVPREGALFTRELPRQQEPFFSWRDTLKWSAPNRASSGVSWRRPGGAARIVVFFTSATAPGFNGYEEALRQMRAAADALEDPASTYEVRVGTGVGVAARLTSHYYPNETLTGSKVTTVVSETVLVNTTRGMYTARFRAPRDEFESQLPAFRRFLLQLDLSPPVKSAPPVEYVLPP